MCLCRTRRGLFALSLGHMWDIRYGKWCTECWIHVLCSCGILQITCCMKSMILVGSFLGGNCVVVSRNCNFVEFNVPIPAGVHCFLLLLHVPVLFSHANSLSDLYDVRQNQASWTGSHRHWEAKYLLNVYFPYGRSKGFHLALSCAALEMEWQWVKWNCSSHLILMLLFTYFAPTGFWDISTVLLSFHRGIFDYSQLSKSLFLKGWRMKIPVHLTDVCVN